MGAFALVYLGFNGAVGLAAIAGPGLAGMLYGKSNRQITMGVLARFVWLGEFARLEAYGVCGEGDVTVQGGNGKVYG